MSAPAVSFVMRHSSATKSTLLVHMMIADSVSEQHRHEFWADHGWLAAKCRLNRHTIVRALADLEELGHIERVEARPGQAIRYRLVLDESRDVVWDGRKRPKPEGGAESTNPEPAAEGVVQKVPTPSEGWCAIHQGVVQEAPGVGTSRTNRTQENSNELPPGGARLRSAPPNEPPVDDQDLPPAARGLPPASTDVQSIVAGYIDDVHAATGARPPGAWIAAAGKATKAALRDGFTPDEIALALGERASRNLNPGSLPHALMDLRRERHLEASAR